MPELPPLDISVPLFPIRQDDVCRFIVHSRVANVTLLFNVLIQTPTGRLLRSEKEYITNSDIDSDTVDIMLPTGFLISAAVQPAAGGFLIGDIFVSALIQQTALNPSHAHIVLFADYVQGTIPLGYPGSRHRHPQDGPGQYTIETPADPSPGANLTFTTNASLRYQILSVFGQLATDSNTANRRPRLILRAGSADVISLFHIYTLAADTTEGFLFAPGIDTVNLASPPRNNLNHPFIVSNGVQIIIDVDDIQVGDQISDVQIAAITWIDP